jgi:pyruvate/2-oxoglutarate dehydrogenase complex dihydrolipoamide acyltransferase (E2) component
MPKADLSYQVVELPRPRRQTHNYLDLYWWKHSVYALLDVDVTTARHIIAQHKARTGEALSFTGYLAFCLARAVAEDKSVQAYLKGRKHLVIFDDVDVFMPVERELGGTQAAIPYVIRRANEKSFPEIHREIRAFQTQPIAPGEGMPSAFRSMMSAPWPLPRLFIRLIRAASRRDPTRLVSAAGTVGVTALGMAGRSGGWGVAPAGQSVLLIVGGISRKPAVVDEHIEPRDFLNLTVAFDHDVVDGAPAARFVQRLVDLIERGHGLEEAREHVPTPATRPG